MVNEIVEKSSFETAIAPLMTDSAISYKCTCLYCICIIVVAKIL